MDAVHRFALSLTRNAADADDLVQETYLRAYRSWHTYQSGTDCRSWLFTICRNAHRYRHDRAPQTIDIADAEHDAVAMGAAFRDVTRVGLADLFSRVNLADAIEQALRRVPEPFQSTLALVDVEDQTYETAASVLGVPVGTVRSRLFRGRRIMQELLMVHAQDAGFATARP